MTGRKLTKKNSLCPYFLGGITFLFQLLVVTRFKPLYFLCLGFSISFSFIFFIQSPVKLKQTSTSLFSSSSLLPFFCVFLFSFILEGLFLLQTMRSMPFRPRTFASKPFSLLFFFLTLFSIWEQLNILSQLFSGISSAQLPSLHANSNSNVLRNAHFFISNF